MKCIFVLILVLIIFKHPRYAIRWMCAGHGRGAIEICLSEKGVLAKKDWETLVYSNKCGLVLGLYTFNILVPFNQTTHCSSTRASAEVFPWGRSRHFAYHFQVADDAIQVTTHETLYHFYATKKMPMFRQQ